MGLNDIVLSPSVIAGFYKKHLVEAGEIISPASTVQAGNTALKTSLQYLGKNQKGICLLVHYPNEVYLPDEQLNFLTSILLACRLNLGDVAIVNQHRQKISFEEICSQLACRHLLVFGVPLSAVGLPDIPLFSMQTINECQVVHSMAADQLNNINPESKLLKGKLWACLKQLFNV
ncbi:MAG: hypothetical protein ABIQ88_13750 [Chitinophagaceae bacterium]